MRRIGVFVLLSLACACPAHAETPAEAALRRHIAVLASDAYGGRKPGTAGENKTIRYISEAFASAGVMPGATDGWFQPVPLIARTQQGATLRFVTDEEIFVPSAGQFVLRGDRASIALSDLPVILAGRPNDAMPPDIGGKLALVLLDDIDNDQSGAFAAAAARLERAGAAGAIALTKAASWYSMRQRAVAGMSELDDRALAPVEGALSPEASDRLLALMGAAEGAVPAVVSVEASVRTRIRRFVSNNVVGRIAGARPESGAVLLIAHWDHLGTCRTGLARDRICNGAVDNASGIAALIEIGRTLAAGPRPDRDIYLLASTSEEDGLLGSRAFAAAPPVPIGRFVAAFNLDSIAIASAGAPLAVIGRGHTPLDPYVAKVARMTGRTIGDTPDADGYYKRQDGWSLMEAGVPALMITGSFADGRWLDPYIDGRYHRPSDEVGAITDLAGEAEDVAFHVALARFFGDAGNYPEQSPAEAGVK